MLQKVPQLIILSVLSFLLLGFWLFLINDEKGIEANAKAKLNMEDLTVARMDKQLRSTQSVLQGYRKNAEEISYFRENFLERKEERIVQISEFLAERAKARGIRLERVSYSSQKTKSKDLDIYQIDLPLEGRYRHIRAFIDDIEHSELFLIITQMSMRDESAGSGAVSMALTLATYFEGTNE